MTNRNATCVCVCAHTSPPTSRISRVTTRRCVAIYPLSVLKIHGTPWWKSNEEYQVSNDNISSFVLLCGTRVSRLFFVRRVSRLFLVRRVSTIRHGFLFPGYVTWTVNISTRPKKTCLGSRWEGRGLREASNSSGELTERSSKKRSRFWHIHVDLYLFISLGRTYV